MPEVANSRSPRGTGMDAAILTLLAVVLAVRLPQHAADVVSQPVELKPQFQVGEAIVVGDVVSVEFRALLGDRYDDGADGELHGRQSSLVIDMCGSCLHYHLAP